MASTSGQYKFPYPDRTDTADIPRDMGLLANAIDTQLGYLTQMISDKDFSKGRVIPNNAEWRQYTNSAGVPSWHVETWKLGKIVIVVGVIQRLPGRPALSWPGTGLFLADLQWAADRNMMCLNMCSDGAVRLDIGSGSKRLVAYRHGTMTPANPGWINIGMTYVTSVTAVVGDKPTDAGAEGTPDA